MAEDEPEPTDETVVNSLRVIPQVIEDEMKRSYLDYAMSVIVGRALPDVRDGLKPVHRRILYAMNDLGMKYGQPFKKCARIVGEVLGKYHPHGDSAVYDSLVRMAQDFSLRYPLINGQGNFGCFTKETEVRLADGRSLSFEQLIKESNEGKTHYTYTIDVAGQIKIAKIERPRLTIKDAKIMNVTLDNGIGIRCTLNHKFMLRDGTYREAWALKAGDSLKPLYTRLSTPEDGLKPAINGYELIFQPESKQWVLAHHLADAYNLENGIYESKMGRVKHHKDFNKLNNNPDNIQRMKWAAHWKLHSDLTKNRHANDPDYVKRLAAGRTAYWAKPENRARQAKRISERNKTNWQKQEYAAHMRETLSRLNKEHIRTHPHLREEYSRRASATLKQLWKDPDYQASMREKIVKGNKNRMTNKTGKRKFLKVCGTVLEKEGTLNQSLYEQYRNVVYPYGRSTGWEKGLQYYETLSVEEILQEACENHKVAKIEFLNQKEDVYDLTVNGTHNFALGAGIFVHNSVDGDSAAAMRYTEARLAKIADELLGDIEKETVDFQENFDGSLTEPSVLPAKLPNLLINGSAGIAVGMATNIPPHNLNEVSAAIITLIDNPEADIAELIEHVKGPDFPTGGIIAGKAGILQAYNTGRGRIRVKSVIEQQEKNGKKQLIVHEIPYMVNKANLVEQIAECVHDKRIEGIADLRDESDRKGMRIAIDLKRDANPEIVENQLLTHTRLQVTFGINIVALVDGRPRTLGLKAILEQYILHRRIVVRRRTEYELRKAQERAHILEGLIIALDNIDAVVALIKEAQNVEAARNGLMDGYGLTTLQANAILDMKLSRLTGLEQEKIRQELDGLRLRIAELEAILADERKILAIIKEELLQLTEKYADSRKTTIVEGEDEEIDLEDLIDPQDQVVTISNAGYAKRMSLELYKEQRRGGKGIRGATTKEDDFIEHLFVANTHDYLLTFTDKGKLYWKKVYYLPEASRQSKGKAMINLIRLEPGEKIEAVIPIKEFTKNEYLLFVTERGTIKKTSLEEYSRPRQGGIRAINLADQDRLVTVLKTEGNDQILLASAKGQAVKFHESDARSMGRTATGVRGIRLRPNDKVIGAIKAPDDKSVLTVTANGYGKRSPLDDYRLINRGGSGVRNIICSGRNGDVVMVKAVDGSESVMLSTKSGIVIRFDTHDIRIISRNTQGVKLMNLNAGDQVVAMAKVAKEEGDEIEATEE